MMPFAGTAVMADCAWLVANNSCISNPSNTPVFLAATGDILIEGTLVVSGRDYFATAGPRGGAPGEPERCFLLRFR